MVFAETIREKRDRLSYSREYAAEKLGISVDRLGRLETEKVAIRPDEVLSMSILYKSPELCNLYCSEVCEIGQKYIPKVPNSDLAVIILRLLTSINRVDNIERLLYEITEDGKVSNKDIPALVTVLQSLEKLSTMSTALQLCVERKKATGALDKEQYDKEVASQNQSE